MCCLQLLRFLMHHTTQNANLYFFASSGTLIQSLLLIEVCIFYSESNCTGLFCVLYLLGVCVSRVNLVSGHCSQSLLECQRKKMPNCTVLANRLMSWYQLCLLICLGKLFEHSMTSNTDISGIDILSLVYSMRGQSWSSSFWVNNSYSSHCKFFSVQSV